MAILHSAPTITAPEDVVNEDFTLAIGPTSESVNIVGAPLLQTDSAAVSTAVDAPIPTTVCGCCCRRRRKIRSNSFYTASAHAAVAQVHRPIINALPLPTGPPIDPACDNIANPCMANLSVVYSNASNIHATSTRVGHSLSSKITLVCPLQPRTISGPRVLARWTPPRTKPWAGAVGGQSVLQESGGPRSAQFTVKVLL
jgi:hypothetical protein